jgi:hypothetical protein
MEGGSVYITELILLLFYFLSFLLYAMSSIILQYSPIASQPPLAYVPPYLYISSPPSLQDPALLLFPVLQFSLLVSSPVHPAICPPAPICPHLPISVLINL